MKRGQLPFPKKRSFSNSFGSLTRISRLTHAVQATSLYPFRRYLTGLVSVRTTPPKTVRLDGVSVTEPQGPHQQGTA